MIATRKRPNADAIPCSSEEITHTADLLKTRIFGQYIPDLIHRGTPTESFIQVIEDFDGVGTTAFS